MIKKEKELKVDILKKDFSDNEGLIFADHSNMKSEQSMAIREKLDDIDANLRIVKNTLAALVAGEYFKGIDFTEIFKGHTSVIVSHKDVISTAKALKDIIKEFDILKIKAGIIDGKLISSEDVDKLASLPSREVLLAQIASGLLSPIFALVNLLNNLPQKLVMTLAAIKKEKELQTN
ncbi:MAG: 50S ribosomal protein L10 [Actinomycetota bacterium]|nr:50S ribosomal protein L10 [Actinomycetota bacterium]